MKFLYQLEGKFAGRWMQVMGIQGSKSYVLGAFHMYSSLLPHPALRIVCWYPYEPENEQRRIVEECEAREAPHGN